MDELNRTLLNFFNDERFLPSVTITAEIGNADKAATRRINALVDAGLLERSGSTRDAACKLTPLGVLARALANGDTAAFETAAAALRKGLR